MHNHSPDPHDVMYPACTVVPQKLSMRDANTLGIIYNFKPSDAILAKIRTYSGNLTSVKPVSLSREQAEAYCKLLSARLSAVKSATIGANLFSCDILLLLDADGCIYNYRITRRSNSMAFDQSVLSALVTSIPLPKPPNGILTTTPDAIERLLLAFTCTSDGKIVPAQPPVDQAGEYVPCAEAGPAQPLYEQEKATATATSGEGESGATGAGLQPGEAQWAAQVRQLAKANFQQDDAGSIVLSMGIKPDGRVAHLSIKQSAANAFVEKAAIDSCILAEPYPKPPGNGDFVRELDISFD
jgi:outer membrane biosynthesis protein TonB